MGVARGCVSPLEIRHESHRSIKPFTNPLVAHAFEAYPPSIRRKMLALRALICRTAAATDGVGELE